MIPNGRSDLRVLTLSSYVITTHKPLKFWEFSDHARYKIGLAQPCGAFDEIGQNFTIFVIPAKAGIHRLLG